MVNMKQEDAFNIILIEDNPDDIKLIETMISCNNGKFGDDGELALINFESLKPAKQYLEKNCVDVILLDLALSDSIGINTIDKLRETLFKIPVVILTGSSDINTAVYALQRGAQDYLIKGEFDDKLLMRVIRYSIERHKLISNLKDLSLIDELTGLYNRRGFLSLAENHLKLIKRRSGGHAAVLFIDLDKLKAINDEYGHKTGDNALIDAANILKESFRGSDIVGRIGGDEFAVFVHELLEKDFGKLCERVGKYTKQINHRGKKNYRISLSIGTAYYKPENMQTIEDLLVEADQSMYEQKKNRM